LQLESLPEIDHSQDHYSVTIAGAGPVGLLIALRLGQAGIKTLVLERHHEILHTTRAVAYQPVVLKMLDDLGLRQRIEESAHLNKQGIFWRDVHGKQLGHLPMPEDEHILLFGQYRMAKLILEEIEKYPCVQVRFGVQYVGCEQNDSNPYVTVMAHETASDNDTTFSTDWLIGTDGANSTVRRSLCIPFEGFSYTDFRMVGADVYYDFAAGEYGSVMNFIVHPDDWAVVIYTGQQQELKPAEEASPLWRVAYTEPSHLSSKPDDIFERAKERVSRYTKDHRPLELIRAEPYRLHQRCAAQAIKGRVILAGDALHSNNPIGGLGLTHGICDAYAIGSALARVCNNEAEPSFITKVVNDRRDTWLNVTDKLSQVNLERLRTTDPSQTFARECFFEGLKNDPEMPARVRRVIQKLAGDDFSLPC
jgi:2-polyprenyl-6-methoxyphenol hydroxylase-like FAD-dependent oxidoreductase